MGILILIRVRVALDLWLDAGALPLFNYAYPLNCMATKCNICFYKFYSSFNDQVGSNGMFSDFRPARTPVLVCVIYLCFYKFRCISLLVGVISIMCPLTL
jgi:hypothetical protein